MPATKELVLYLTPLGAPCRAVMLCARALGVDLQSRELDMHVKGEHRTEWFAKINPQKMVPTLVDGDYVLWESRAINKYLTMQHGGGSAIAQQLWPSDLRHQSLVDRLMYFDLDFLYRTMTEYFKPMLIFEKAPEKDKLEALEDSLRVLDNFLEKGEFAAGPNLTLADISLIASVTQLPAYSYEIDPQRFPKVASWEERVRSELPFFDEVCREGLNRSTAWATSRLKNIKQ